MLNFINEKEMRLDNFISPIQAFPWTGTEQEDFFRMDIDR